MVRMTLELQDYVRGEYAVLARAGPSAASRTSNRSGCPSSRQGRTDRRLMALENAGRDEVAIDPRDIVGLEPINRQQQAWRDLAAVAGRQRHAGICRCG